MDKALVMNEIDEILDTYCDGCFLKKHLSKDRGKTAAHNFCITHCTVGEHLKFLGEEMNKLIK
ncbi:zinc-finger domain-containing protein [Sporosarcina siberiensis]|uniref:Zinc-finger domain-containing protein n=1 Tax=Sporosarcina siberiensis TaxID=1365606 RepID=A0ABW4SFL3_9BACL